MAATKENFSNFFSKHICVLQLALVFLFGVAGTMANLKYGERIPVENGLGYDGVYYAELALDYPAHITKAIDAKYFQRSLPSFLVYSFCRTFHLEAANQNILAVFSGLNLLLLLGAVYIWNRICLLSSLQPRANWLGYTLLFINFGFLKFPFFYPVLTDTCGFFLSLLLLFFFKKENKVGVLLVMLLSAFSWPALEYMCLPVLFFMPGKIEATGKGIYIRAAAVLALVVCFVSLAAYLIYKHPNMRGGWFEQTDIVKHGILPSLLATGLVLFGMLYALLKNIAFPKNVLKLVDVKFAIVGLVLFVAIDMAIKFLTRKFGIHSGYSIRMYLNDLLIIGSRQPFCFLVAHFAYFGPVITLCVICWKRICTLVIDQGWAMFFIFLQLSFFALDSESRHSLNYLPFIALMLAEGLREKISKPLAVTGFILSLLFSKALVSLFVFPTHSWADNYNMHFGFSLSDAAYLSYLAFFLAVTALFYFMVGKSPQKETGRPQISHIP